MITKTGETENDIRKYESINTFFENHKKKCKGYDTGFRKYFDYIKKNPDEYFIKINENSRHMPNNLELQDMTKKERQRITKQIRMFQTDLELFFKYMVKTNNLSIKTINNYMVMLRSLFTFYEYHTYLKWDNLTLDENKPVFEMKYRGTENKIITREILQDILNMTNDIKIKAVITFLVSSGIRRGELFKLELKHVNLDSDPVEVNIPADIAKTGTARTTYISNEAKEYIEIWLKPDNEGKTPRDKYIIQSYNRATIKKRFGAVMKKTLDDPRIFPFSPGVFNKIWNDLLEKTGYADRDKNTSSEFHLYHVHTLRKYFCRMGAKAPHPNNTLFIEEMMGHKGYLSKANYPKQDDKDIKNYYKQVEKEGLLTIQTTPHQVKQTQKEVDILKEQIKKQDERIHQLEIIKEYFTSEKKKELNNPKEIKS